ncbi:hypothetical protein ACFV2B_30075 [Streptomyces lavendulae]|uniref:hypothetical protein n=1 Tax=Streptomyces lavendulae TaxID=1914 RepID=UPI003689D033
MEPERAKGEFTAWVDVNFWCPTANMCPKTFAPIFPGYYKMLEPELGRCYVLADPPKGREVVINHNFGAVQFENGTSALASTYWDLDCKKLAHEVDRGAKLAVSQDPRVWKPARADGHAKSVRFSALPGSPPAFTGVYEDKSPAGSKFHEPKDNVLENSPTVWKPPTERAAGR